MIELLPHQAPVLEWAEPRSRIALFLEMRLGKTIVTMRWAKARGLKRILLLAPWNTLVGTRNWQGELAREGERTTMLCLMKTPQRYNASQWQWGLEPSRFGGTQMRRRIATGWFLLHYEGLRVAPEVLDLPWDAIIVDESTRIRSPKAQVTKLLINRAHAEHKALLSGMPNPEDPMDYFTQFVFLLGHFMNATNYWAFRQKYFNQGGAGWQWFPRKGTIDKMKAFVRANAYVLTRTQAKIGSKKVYEMRSVPMGAKQRKAMTEVAKKYAYGDEETKWAPVVHTWMRKIAGGFAPTKDVQLLDDGKLRLLFEVLKEEFPRQSVVVWFGFNHEIDYAYDFLKQRKVSCERVHGNLKMPRTERSRIQDRFQEGKTRVLLMQVALGQFGWNLSRADVVVYYSNSYEFEDRSQSEDRVIHPTKTVPCLFLDLVYIGSTDEDVTDSLREKKVDAKRFTGVMAAAMAARLSKITRINPWD